MTIRFYALQTKNLAVILALKTTKFCSKNGLETRSREYGQILSGDVVLWTNRNITSRILVHNTTLSGQVTWHVDRAIQTQFLRAKWDRYQAL